MKVVKIKCSEIQNDFYYDEEGVLKSWYDPKEEIVVELEDYDEDDYNDESEEKALTYKMIIDGELDLPLSERFNLLSAYNSVYEHFAYKNSLDLNPREILDRIKLRTRIIANREKDIAIYLRKYHSHYLELFEQCSCADEVLTSTLESLSGRAIHAVLFPNDLFGSGFVGIKERPYDFSYCDNIWTWGRFRKALDRNDTFKEYLKALSYLSIIRWLQVGIWYCECSDLKKVIDIFKNNKEKQYKDSTSDSLSLKGLSQAQKALYFVYTHETRSLPAFGSDKGIVADMKKVAEECGCSYKSFQGFYNRFSKRKSERMALSNLANIKTILPFLKNFLKAYDMAYDELTIASKR